MIIPLSSALMRMYLESCDQFWAFQSWKRPEVQEQAQEKTLCKDEVESISSIQL